MFYDAHQMATDFVCCCFVKPCFAHTECFFSALCLNGRDSLKKKRLVSQLVSWCLAGKLKLMGELLQQQEGSNKYRLGRVGSSHNIFTKL